MGKVYFYYGTMSAGKTSLAINKAYEFREKGRNVYVCVPSLVKKDKLESRNGSSVDVDLVLDNEEYDSCVDKIEEFSTLIIDEAQFLNEHQVGLLKSLSEDLSLSVFCFGLLTDYKMNLFEGSKALIQYADSIRELPSMCDFCENKAKYNFRTTNDHKQVVLDKNIYKTLCYDCFIRYSNKDEA